VSKNQFLPPKVRRPRRDLAPIVDQAESLFGFTVAGSYRRQKDMVGDLDLLVPPWRDFNEACVELMETWNYEPARQGPLKSEGSVQWEGSTLLLNLWRVPEPNAWGGMLLFATGPYDLNIMMRSKAKGKGWTLSQYGLFEPDNDPTKDLRQLDGDTREGVRTRSIVEDLEDLEKDIFTLLGLTYVSPVERENWRDYLLPSHKVERDTVEVRSSDGVTIYHVDMENGRAIECECKGFSYRRSCRHLAEAEAKARRSS
jgi:DNA polymerase/3'-5' exonuclease PolX